MGLSGLLARVAYGLAFCGALPLAMVLLSRRLDAWVPLALPAAPAVGTGLLAGGLFLMAWAMAWLRWRGGGLPMNAFPPPRRVVTGPYAVLGHPVYAGFLLAWSGWCLHASSPGGFWVLGPLAACGCAALVWGYEGPGLRARFGEAPRPWLALPAGGPGRPARLEAAGTGALVFGVWLLAYQGVRVLGRPPDALPLWLPWELRGPVWGWTEPIYASVYLVAPLAVFFALRREDLRRFALQGLAATALCTIAYLALPVETPPRPHAAAGLLGDLMDLERAASVPATASFPSFHALWALLAADLLAGRGPRWAWGAWTWALLCVASCWTTGMHGVLDLAAALPAFLLVRRPAGAWERLRRGAEAASNGWREWRIGPVRVINHGLWAGLGGGTGLLLTAWLSGEPGWSLLLCLCGLVGAGLWAQLVEGSPALLRPFGYFGTLAVLPVAGLAIRLGGGPALRVIAAFAVAGPAIQALGRVRCLIQGCCHGRPAAEGVGIRVKQAHSRVCKVTSLVDTPIHPTPLYSILGNLLLLPLLLRGWWLGLPLGLLGGAYLALAGCLRFAEEGYRGEPQTRHVAGLSLYQWLSMLMVLAGGLVMALPPVAAPAPAASPGPAAWAAAAGFGVLCAAALGLDFPESRRRFARLSG